MVFEFCLGSGETKIFKEAFETLRDVPIPQASIRLDDSGLSLQAMDSTHVSVAKLVFQSGFFQSFSCHCPEIIGLDLICLTKVFKALQPKDHLTWSYGGDKLEMCLISSRTQKFTLNLLDISEDELQIPEIPKDYVATLSPSYFQTMIQGISLVEGLNCCITMSDNKLILSSEGDLGTTDIYIEEEITKKSQEPNLVQVQGTEDKKKKKKKDTSPRCVFLKKHQLKQEVRSEFSINFLRNFAKAAVLTEHPVQVSLKKDFPLELNYRLPADSYLQFYIAPKCDD